MSPKSRDKSGSTKSKPAAKGKPKSAAKAKTGKMAAPVTKKVTSPKADAKAKAKTASATLADGAKAPAFSVQLQDGKTASLSDFAGRNLVIFFYPRADTPGCTTEAKDFTRLATSFDKANTALLGVSADPAKTQSRFRDKHKLAMPLGSDEQQTMLTAYGAWGEKSMYGRAFMGVLRSTVLIDAKGRIVKTWSNVKVDGHADEVLAAAKAIGS